MLRTSPIDRWSTFFLVFSVAERRRASAPSPQFMRSGVAFRAQARPTKSSIRVAEHCSDGADQAERVRSPDARRPPLPFHL